MGTFRYITNRTLENKAGQEAGRIKAAVRNGSDLLEGEYTCPECSHAGKISQPFERPLAVRCGGCDRTIKLPKIRSMVKH